MGRIRGKEWLDKTRRGSGTKEAVLANAKALARSILKGPQLFRRAAPEKTHKLRHGQQEKSLHLP